MKNRLGFGRAGRTLGGRVWAKRRKAILQFEIGHFRHTAIDRIRHREIKSLLGCKGLEGTPSPQLSD